MAEEMGNDIPTMDDFLGDSVNKSKDLDMQINSHDNKRKSMILP
jgi:hypothetical protein